MKKVITTVGTSIFENTLDKIEQDYGKIKDKPNSRWEENSRDINNIRKILLDIFSNSKDKNTSAEITSICKIQEELKEDLEVYLLATDTIVSRLACELIQKFFEANENIKIIFNPNTDVIKGLQVKNRKDFEKEGIINLINKLNTIANYYWDNCALNITGGYKAIIPYMTIIGQVNKMPCYYIFQEGDEPNSELIKIPQAPIDINYSIFEKYEREFNTLDNSNIVNTKDLSFHFIADCGSCLEISGEDVVLNPLGVILWTKYKTKFIFFYTPEDVWNEIQKQENIKRILKEKFPSLQLIDSKTETKGEHKVFDDGNNNNRIYYFIDNEKIYIYKTFENEAKAKKYIEEPINKIDILEKSKIRRLDL